jgi:hypothetical protein
VLESYNKAIEKLSKILPLFFSKPLQKGSDYRYNQNKTPRIPTIITGVHRDFGKLSNPSQAHFRLSRASNACLEQQDDRKVPPLR